MKNESTRPPMTWPPAACGSGSFGKQTDTRRRSWQSCLEIDRSFLSRIEAGAKGCSVDLFISLAVVFHTSLDHLILGRAPEQTQLRQELLP